MGICHYSIMATRNWAPALTAGITALVAHIPCCGPAVLLAAGGSAATAGAGWLAFLEPYQPYLWALAVLQVAVGFYWAYKPQPACQHCEASPEPTEHAQQQAAMRNTRIATSWVGFFLVLGIMVWSGLQSHDHSHAHQETAAVQTPVSR